MKISGWVRVWIVASIMIWGGGFFWLQSITYSYLPELEEVGASVRYPTHMPPLQPDLSVCRSDEQRDGVIVGPSCQSQLTEVWEYQWQQWLEQSGEAGHLPLVLFSPFILGGLMLGVSWIIRGFRPQPAKGGADANKPPPVGPSPSGGV